MNLRRYFLILFHRIKFMISCFSCTIDDIVSVLLHCYPANKLSYAMNKIHAKVKIRNIRLCSWLLINQTFNTLAVQYCAKICNEFAGFISASMRLMATKLFSKKYSSSSEPLAKIWASDLPLQSHTCYRSTNLWPVITHIHRWAQVR